MQNQLSATYSFFDLPHNILFFHLVTMLQFMHFLSLCKYFQSRGQSFETHLDLNSLEHTPGKVDGLHIEYC